MEYKQFALPESEKITGDLDDFIFSDCEYSVSEK